MQNWFEIKNSEKIDSPSLLIYKDRVERNIEKMISIAGSTSRLFVHVKTNKMPEVIKLLLNQGIRQFKAATIAEAEMVAEVCSSLPQRDTFIVIAHQLVSFKIKRLVELYKKYPNIYFASLVDCEEIGNETNEIFSENNLTANIFLDVNNGMDRSGHELNSKILELYKYLNKQSNLNICGLHVYDGHLRASDFETRKREINDGFGDVLQLKEAIIGEKMNSPMIIAGGTAAFTSHALREQTYCSPGTCVLWDWGYGDKFEEQKFDFAALVFTRVISKPAKGIITIDMGHKAVAAENPIDKRIRFLNLQNYELISQSEEHGVLKVDDWENIEVGDEFYGVPYHVCPTVNLYDEAYSVENQEVTGIWEVKGRKRRITI